MKLASIPFHYRIIAALLLGAIFGATFGASIGPIGEIGKTLINLIKVLATPLLFFAILESFLKTHIPLRSGAKMLVISLSNGAIALGIGLAISNTLHPGVGLSSLTGLSRPDPSLSQFSRKKLDFVSVVLNHIPSSVFQPFAENDVIGVIFLAVLLGMALRSTTQGGSSKIRELVEELTTLCLKTVEKLLSWVIQLVPIAVFAVVAKTVGEQGFFPIRGLAVYVGAALLGLLVHVLLVYQSWLLWARYPLAKFWSGARDAIAYAIGASSSLATLPVTLRCLDRMGVSPKSARLAACVGTNFNNDGILLYEAMAVLVVAQAHGIHLSLGQQAAAALSCLAAGIGIAGVPEAGLISLSIVLTTVGLPLELLPLLLTVDWILSRARAVTNVISDILVSVLLDTSETSQVAR